MNKKTMIFTIPTIIFSTIICLVGCSNNKTTNKTSSIAREKINIEDISWNIDEGIVDGDRYVLLNYINNTKYTITDFELTFKEKTDITEEEKSNFYSDIQQNINLSDEDMEEIRNLPISMHTATNKVIEPGESVSNINCYYYGGYTYLKDINHYNLVEPDIATIKYIDKDKIHTEYYDYDSKKYSFESETEMAYQWSKTAIGDKIPKPDVKVVESDSDNESIFMFDAYGLSLDQFNTYVEKCKNLGYTIDSSGFEGFYSADNEEDYNVYLYYNEKNNSMSGTISAPKTKSE